MKDIFKELLQAHKVDTTPELDQPDEKKKIQIATCALFLEVANSDENFSDDERKKIIEIMKSTFKLDTEEVENLIDLSEEHRKRSISIYEFTDIVNQNFVDAEKKEVLKNLWRLVYVDEELHQYEDYYVRKISTNLKMPHEQFIASKLEVKKEMNI
ncbi:MAG: hypothetical protein SCALA702_34980 [Melioribacteraceae bacterium]|nr:MAG: hypothetical protein SCALA702_34980 [Melioribacteraceae bacterium]